MSDFLYIFKNLKMDDKCREKAKQVAINNFTYV